jgi:hypothetical protein
MLAIVNPSVGRHVADGMVETLLQFGLGKHKGTKK